MPSAAMQSICALESPNCRSGGNSSPGPLSERCPVWRRNCQSAVGTATADVKRNTSAARCSPIQASRNPAAATKDAMSAGATHDSTPATWDQSVVVCHTPMVMARSTIHPPTYIVTCEASRRLLSRIQGEAGLCSSRSTCLIGWRSSSVASPCRCHRSASERWRSTSSSKRVYSRRGFAATVSPALKRRMSASISRASAYRWAGSGSRAASAIRCSEADMSSTMVSGSGASPSLHRLIVSAVDGASNGQRSVSKT